MDRKTKFNASFKYFSHIELTEGPVKEQYARDQVFCMKNSASSGTLGKGLGSKPRLRRSFFPIEKRGSIAHSLSLSTAHRPDNAEIVLKRTLNYAIHPCIYY